MTTNETKHTPLMQDPESLRTKVYLAIGRNTKCTEESNDGHNRSIFGAEGVPEATDAILALVEPIQAQRDALLAAAEAMSDILGRYSVGNMILKHDEADADSYYSAFRALRTALGSAVPGGT